MNWNNRGDRLARMRERDEFGKYFMPLAYLVGMVGLGLLAFGVIDQIQTDARNLHSIGMGICLLAVPLILFFFRLARGHFSPRLRD